MSPVLRALQAETRRQGLTAYALAKQTGLSITTIDRALRGRVSPTVATMEAIARALGVVVEVRRS